MDFHVEPDFKHRTEEPRFFVRPVAADDQVNTAEIQFLNNFGFGATFLRFGPFDKDFTLLNILLPQEVVQAARSGVHGYIDSTGQKCAPRFYLEPDDCLRRIRRHSQLAALGKITMDEFVGEFLYLVIELPIATIPECVARIPSEARPAICQYLIEFAELDFFDTRNMFDKRSHDHKRAMHDHYETVTKALATHLGCDCSSA